MTGRVTGRHGGRQAGGQAGSCSPARGGVCRRAPLDSLLGDRWAAPRLRACLSGPAVCSCLHLSGTSGWLPLTSPHPCTRAAAEVKERCRRPCEDVCGRVDRRLRGCHQPAHGHHALPQAAQQCPLPQASCRTCLLLGLTDRYKLWCLHGSWTCCPQSCGRQKLQTHCACRISMPMCTLVSRLS